MSLPFAALLERGALHRMAGTRSFERGEDYFLGGQVKALAEQEGMVTAKVQGTQPYRVKLWIENADLDYLCTCPMGAEGEFCKHCVAVGLTWLENREAKRSEKGQQASGVTMDDVGAYLLGQDKSALVEMLMEQAMEDDHLRQRLFMKAAKKSTKRINLVTYRRAIDEAVDRTDLWTTEALISMPAGLKMSSIQ